MPQQIKFDKYPEKTVQGYKAVQGWEDVRECLDKAAKENGVLTAEPLWTEPCTAFIKTARCWIPIPQQTAGNSRPGIIPAAPGIPCGRFPPARGTCWTKPFIP